MIRAFVAGAWLLAMGMVATAPGAAQDGDGFIAPMEDPIAGGGDGDSIQGGGAPLDVSYYPSPRLMYATTSSAVRSGPGTGNPQIGTIPYGGQVTVLGSAGGGAWLYLQLASGGRGFTASHLLSTSRPSASSGGSGTSGSGSSPPNCAPGEVVIRMSDGSSICARLQ